MQIGLIGGIGPAATDYSYRRLIADFASWLRLARSQALSVPFLIRRASG